MIFTGTGSYTASGSFVPVCQQYFEADAVELTHTEIATATASTQEEANRKAQQAAQEKAEAYIVNHGPTYAEEQKICVQKIFPSTQTHTATEFVTKNDCKTNEMGTTVEVTVIKTASATGSTQTEADALALSIATDLATTTLNQTKQTTANLQGQCVQTIFTGTYTATGSHIFTKNDCESGTPSDVTYTTSATRTTQA